jgi:hypothetical protein
MVNRMPGMVSEGEHYAKMFMEELRKHSLNQSDPIPEWQLLDPVSRGDGGGLHCICTKEIIQIYTIKHKDTKKELEIGCDCAKRWMDCSLCCKGCMSPLGNVMKRRKEKNFHCPTCTKHIKKEGTTMYFAYRKTFAELVEDEAFVNRIVNECHPTFSMATRFLQYAKYFYTFSEE